jgi:tetratricopeptide (TPR) repeat protein
MREIMPLAKSLLSNHGRDPLVLSFAAIVHGYMAYTKFEAAQAMRQAKTLAPNSGLVLQCAGWVLSYVEAYDKAIACFQRAMRLDPLGHSSGYCSIGLGACLLLSGRAEEAIPALEGRICRRAGIWHSHHIVDERVFRSRLGG